MSNDSFTPLPSQALAADAQIRAYVHPTRMTILALLAAEARTVTGVARELGVHPANLTHHFRLLEKAGLILLVEKRDTGKNLEKYYRAAAYHFTVSPAEDQPSGQAALALTILRDNLTAAIQAMKAAGKNAAVAGKTSAASGAAPDEPNVLALLASTRVLPEDLERFASRLEALREEFSALNADTGELYTLNMSLYPGDAVGTGSHEVRLESGA